MNKDVNKARRAIGFTERGLIASAWNNKCAYCKTTDGPFAVDHIVPHSASGTCDVDNLCWACSKCNAQKSDTRLPIFQEGLLLALAVRRAKTIKAKLKAAQTASNTKVKKKNVKKPLSEAARQLNQRGLRVLEALLSSGLIEDRREPQSVKCNSKPLQGSFFSELGLTPHDTFDCLSNLSWHSRNGLLDYNGRGGPMVGGLNFSVETIADTDLHVFSFDKSLSELNLFTSRIKQQMGVPAKPFVELIDIPDTSFATHLSLSQLSEAYKLLSLILSKGITKKREESCPEYHDLVWFESAFVLPQGTTDAKLLLHEIFYFGKPVGAHPGSPRLICDYIKCTETGEMQFSFIAPMKELKKLKQGISKFLNQAKEAA